MVFSNKITDLKFHINGLVSKDTCKYLIKFYEDNKHESLPEGSYKYKYKKRIDDNFLCMNLSKLSVLDDKFKKPFNTARAYISIMIANYVLHIQKNICPTFDELLIKKTSNLRILKYEKGQFIGDHTDVEGSIRASCTINLNEDYEGGEFRFFNGQEKISFKTGDAMLFPAEPIWIHGTEPITKGVRYSINCFLHE
jgi:hypothetical protein|tara:strand:- start:4288 stop:4875 length:588 start_codon:yes stop_codon:yes gene_type:complete